MYSHECVRCSYYEITEDMCLNDENCQAVPIISDEERITRFRARLATFFRGENTMASTNPFVGKISGQPYTYGTGTSPRISDTEDSWPQFSPTFATAPEHKPEKSLCDAVRENDWEAVVQVVKHLERRNARLERELVFYKRSDKSLESLKNQRYEETNKLMNIMFSRDAEISELKRVTKTQNAEITRLLKVGVFPWTVTSAVPTYPTNRFEDLDMVSQTEALEHKMKKEKYQ
jgi:hypothetical protein